MKIKKILILSICCLLLVGCKKEQKLVCEKDYQENLGNYQEKVEFTFEKDKLTYYTQKFTFNCLNDECVDEVGDNYLAELDNIVSYGLSKDFNKEGNIITITFSSSAENIKAAAINNNVKPYIDTNLKKEDYINNMQSNGYFCQK